MFIHVKRTYKLTPQPVSRAVRMDPSLSEIRRSISSMYASAPFGNMVPPPGNRNLSPSTRIQFCTAFSTVSSLCGTLANQAMPLLTGHGNGFLYPGGAGIRHFNNSFFAGQCLSRYISFSRGNFSDLSRSSHGVYSEYFTSHGWNLFVLPAATGDSSTVWWAVKSREEAAKLDGEEAVTGRLYLQEMVLKMVEMEEPVVFRLCCHIPRK